MADLRLTNAALADDRSPARPDRTRRGPLRRYNFHPPGVLFIGLTVLLGIGAVNSQNNLLFLTFGAAMGAILVSGLASGPMMMRLTVRRTPVPIGTVGRPLTLGYTVENRSRFGPAFSINIRERRSPSQAVPAPSPNAGPEAALDPEPRAFVAHLAPKTTIAAHALVTPRSRGVVRLEGPVLHSTFPFGLFRKSLARDQPADLVAAPAALPVPDAFIQQLMLRAAQGARVGQRRGLGGDFFALRDYVPGASPRAIAWKPSARTGTLVTRITAEPAARRAWLVIDAREASDAEPVEGMLVLAVSIAARLRDLGVEVGVVMPARGVQIAPSPAHAHWPVILEAFARFEPSASPGPDVVPRARTARGDAVIGLTPDGTPPRGSIRCSLVLGAGDLRAWTSADPGASPVPTPSGMGGAA